MELQAPAEVGDEVKRLRERIALLEYRVGELEHVAPGLAGESPTQHRQRT